MSLGFDGRPSEAPRTASRVFLFLSYYMPHHYKRVLVYPTFIMYKDELLADYIWDEVGNPVFTFIEKYKFANDLDPSYHASIAASHIWYEGALY